MNRPAVLSFVCLALPSVAGADALAMTVNACKTKSAVATAAADLRAEGFRSFSTEDSQIYIDFAAAPTLHAFLQVDTQDGLTEAKAAALKSMATKETELAPRKAAMLGAVPEARPNLISPDGMVVVRMIPTASVKSTETVTSCSINSAYYSSADKIIQHLTLGTENAFHTEYYNPNGAKKGGVLSVTILKAAPFEAFYDKPFVATHQINVMYNPTVPSS